VSDELAAATPQVHRVEDGQVEADAMLKVDEANAQLAIDLPESDDYETLAGLLMTRLGRVPKQGEMVRVGNFKLTVTRMQGPKIEKVLIARTGDKK
jgi:putative hemolysin